MVETLRHGACQVSGLLTSSGSEPEQVVCSSDPDQSATYGNCYTLTGSSNLKLGKPLELVLEYAVAVSAVSDTSALLCYSGSPDSQPGRCQLLSKHRDTLRTTIIGEVELRSNQVLIIATEVLNLADDIFACCYLSHKDGETRMICQAVVLGEGNHLQSGPDLDVGNEDPSGDPVSSLSLAQLDNDKVLLCWSRSKGGVFTTVIQSSGTTLSASEQMRISEWQARAVTSSPVYLNKAVVCWNAKNSDSWGFLYCMGIESNGGSALSSGDQYLVRQAEEDLGSMAMTPLAAHECLLCYADHTNKRYVCKPLKAEGIELLSGKDRIYEGNKHGQLSLSRLSDSSAVLCDKTTGSSVNCRTLDSIASSTGTLVAVGTGSQTTTTTEVAWGLPWWAWMLIVCVPCLLIASALAAYRLLFRSGGASGTPFIAGQKAKRKDKTRSLAMEPEPSPGEPPSAPRAGGRSGAEAASRRFQESPGSPGSESNSDSGSSSGSEVDQSRESHWRFFPPARGQGGPEQY